MMAMLRGCWRQNMREGKKLPSESCKNCMDHVIDLVYGKVKMRWNARFYWAYSAAAPKETLWRRGCIRLCGATRYQVVSSTDGVRRLPG